jgi:hypothetical protein
MEANIVWGLNKLLETYAPTTSVTNKTCSKVHWSRIESLQFAIFPLLKSELSQILPKTFHSASCHDEHCSLIKLAGQ